MTVDEQLDILQSGTADIVPLADLKTKLQRGVPLRVKLGVDPTAPDLHLGHAVPLRKLRQFQDCGHTVTLIIGDFTALIGDPSGRNTTRPPLTPQQVNDNAQTYVTQAFRILDPDRTQLRRNSEWLGSLDFRQVLQLTAQFTVARILERDDFQQRYRDQKPISLHEFLYPVAQAYDSVAIQADVELGGTDQLFNLLAGRELMEKSGLEPQVCLTLPLLEGIDGVRKMSKSYGNYVGLTDEAADMFGKVMSIPDTLMPAWFTLASGLPLPDIRSIRAGLTDGTADPNATKRRLARAIIALYHGEAAALEAEAAFDRVFKRHEVPDDIPAFQLSEVSTPNPEGLVYVPAVMVAVGLSASAGEARRLIDGGGVKVDGSALPAKTYQLETSLVENSVIQVGKRKFARLVA